MKADVNEHFASHSLQRGGATFMSMIDCPVPQIKARGRWRLDCIYRYIKPQIEAIVKADKKVAKMSKFVLNL